MIQPSYVYKARITNVVDGDTVDAVVDIGFRLSAMLRLRLARVDTAELNATDPAIRVAAVNSKAFVVGAVLDKEVVVETKKADSFGRYLAEVYYVIDGLQHNLSDDLLAAGMAIPYK
jgi:micrococcal nuclease